ncbi:COG3 [Candida pseudojiufengensis]|uniref:COG3 n=1 Tax=Candida pseudojiufengensis TaxID=497109 RepID=UPI0022240D78|nr:COG3 [Candida pseudojiufengensis]KAI5962371.1 COG3 [Candida pseudojiufengensis]
MPRVRSKSTVSQIANDVPIISESTTNFKHSPTTFKKSRSRSLSSYKPSIKPPIDLTTPFNEEEKDRLWTNYINSFNYDLVLKPQDIHTINNKHLQNVINFQDNLHINQNQLQNFINQTDNLIIDMNELFNRYKKITNETLDFDKSANELLKKQDNYQQKYDEIYSNLKHFENLDLITKNLLKSGSHLLNQKRTFFKNDILKSLDESLEFVDKHPNYKDCELYKSRFQQCMIRSLTLIRNFLNNELRGINDSIYKKSKSLELDLLIYNEFNNYLKYNGDQFHELMYELKSRSNKDEYFGLFNDVLSNYLNIRKKLLNQYINKYSSKEHSDNSLVQSCQDQISYYKNLIEKEFSLFKSFFQPNNNDEINDLLSDTFYNFLKGVLEPLYDDIRLLILKESNISSLCQFTTLLQKYYEFEDNEGSLSNQNYFSNDESIKYGYLFQPILDDCQNRLIFKIQNYIDNQLIKYKPKTIDLKIGFKKQTNNKHSLDVDYEDNLFPEIYLPLAKALTILSNIYELVNGYVFDDIAHYIVHASIEMLRGEYLKLAINQLGIIEGKILYLKNLIILRDQIKNFDIQFIRNDFTIDFKSGFINIWNFIKFQNSNGIIEVVKQSIPKVINNMIDANMEIEMELNNSVTEFLTICSNEICKPILGEKLNNDNLNKFKDNLIIKIPNYYKQIINIINDQIITKFLMNNLSQLILITYEEFFNSITTEQSPQFEDLLEIDALSGFVNDIINHLYEEEELKNEQSEITFNENILNTFDLNLDENDIEDSKNSLHLNIDTNLSIDPTDIDSNT